MQVLQNEKLCSFYEILTPEEGVKVLTKSGEIQ